jgi:hypothetical protein
VKTTWNEDEENALQGLPLRAQIIYLRGIRRYMNYATGITGGKERRISLPMLTETVEEYVNRERQDKPTKHAIRASIEQLKRAGLIERVDDIEHLVFFLPLADTNNSAQINNRTTTARQPHDNRTDNRTDNVTVNASNGAAYRDNNDTNNRTAKNGKNQEISKSALTTAHIRKQETGNQESITKVIDIDSKANPALRLLAEFSITGELAKDFVTHRKNKKAAITKTAMEGLRREAAAAGIAITDAVRESIERGWTGFKADWHKQLSYKQGNDNGRYSITTEDIESAF